MKLSDIRAALAELQLTPSKTLGQNFLHDQNLARWIVAQLGAGPGTELVEVGPGLGALTGVALETGARLTILEKDRRLADFLRARLGGEERLRVITGDALDFDVRELWGRGPVCIFGNLPYYVSTPLLFHFTSPACPAERAVFLLQRELAERLAATGPGTKDYGLVSVIIGRRWQVRLLRVLPASVFLPEPKVDSALIALTRRAPDELPACDVPTFESIVRAGFSQRRKQLRKLLGERVAAGLTPDWAGTTRRLGVPATVRGEELDVRQWIALSNIIYPVNAGAAQNVELELFDVVDEHDRPIAVEPRGVVHSRGLRHRAVHLFVFNARGELFLQKRSPWKDRHPGQWDSSASGHLDHGEDYLTAARRELAEELGIAYEAIDAGGGLQQVGRLEAAERTGWEFIRLFRCEWDGPIRWPAAEIEWGGFFPIEVIERWIASNPGDFAPGFLECWRLRREARGPAGSKTA